MPHSPIVQLLTLAAFLASGFALWKGGTPERWAGALNAADLAIGFVLKSLPLETQDQFRFADDLVPAIAFLILALRYASPWLGAVMLCYAAEFSLHAYYAVLHLPTHSYLHAVLNNLDFTAIVICLSAGTAVAWRRRILDRQGAERGLARAAAGAGP